MATAIRMIREDWRESLIPPYFPPVGAGSCSFVSESMDDSDLADWIREIFADDPRADSNIPPRTIAKEIREIAGTVAGVRPLVTGAHRWIDGDYGRQERRRNFRF
jgi:hypothetical protein